KVEVEAKSQINWKNFDTKFIPRLKKLEDSSIQYIHPFYEVYKNQLTSYYHSKFNTSTSVRINHNFSLSNCNEQCEDQYVYLIAKTIRGKTPAKLLHNGVTYPIKIRYKINQYGNVIEKKLYNSSLTNPDYTITLSANSSDVVFNSGDQIFFEYYTNEASIATRLSNYQNTQKLIYYSSGADAQSVYNGTASNGLYKANIFYWYNLTGMGTLYRNWGQFAYKGAAPNEDFKRINRRYIGLNNLAGMTNEN